MLLLDEIVEQTQDSIICRKTFRENEFFFQGHYPDFPIVPGVILCESAMQAGARPDDGRKMVRFRLSTSYTRQNRPTIAYEQKKT